ncbi:MAG: tetratricopeptide repeat protein [Bosea sp. (in: a-proteobacteria)]
MPALMLIGAVLLPSSAHAQRPATPEPDTAYGAYQTGFYRLAFQIATQRIERDGRDAAAMTLLGEILRQGLGVRQDAAKAADWYRIAAERGDANAAFSFAMMLLRGEGVARDVTRGRQLLERAAQTQPLAAYNLAVTLLGSAEAADRARAVTLLERSSAAEIPDAQHALAVLKREGRDTPQDVDGAADLLRRAAQNGLEAGEIEYAIMLFNGRGVGRDERSAADIFERVAGRGNPIAQNRYARLLAAGRGRIASPIDAAAWNILATQQGLQDESLERLFDNLSPDDKSRALARAAALQPASLTAPTPTRQ